MESTRRVQRLRIFATIVVFMFVALGTRLWQLQVLGAERYRLEASSNSVRQIEEAAPRGKIVDRNGAPLVENSASIQVTVNRQQSAEDRATVVANLAPLLGITPEVLTSRIEDVRYYPFAPVPVAFGVDQRVYFAIREYPEDFPGADAHTVGTRIYPQGEIAAHLFGHIGPLSEEDAQDDYFKDYAPDEPAGRDGLERQYERDLRGQKGIVSKRVNASGKVQGTLGRIDPIPGNTLVTTLDNKLQSKVETMLGNGMDRVKGTSAAAVVLDAKDGGILAMASLPSYSPTVWDNGINEKERKQLGLPRTCRDETGAIVACSLDPHEPKNPPLLNVATTGEFAPGSAIKPFVALAALADGMATEHEKIPCPASWTAPTDQNFTVHNWNPINQPPMDLREALVVSCDTVFYELGQRFYNKYHKDWQSDGTAIVGVPLFQQALEAFGFGDWTGVDLPTGVPGLVPDQNWKYVTYKDVVPNNSKWRCDYNWCPGDSVFMAIGQKDLRVTPLQMAAAYATIAEDGMRCQPHLGLRVDSAAGKLVRTIKPVCHKAEGFTADEYSYVKQGLTGVVQTNAGTASSAFVGFPFGKVDVMGKTGTAQVEAHKNADNAWFAAIAKGTGEDKQEHTYVVVVLIEGGGHGGVAAAPVARQIIEAAYGLDASSFRLGVNTD